MKPTIQEVASAAGVSIGTVSRALRGHATVSHEKATHVREVAKAMNYRPLRQRTATGAATTPLKNKNIILALLGMDRSLSTLPVVAEAIHGVESAVTRAGGRLILADVPHLDETPLLAMQNNIDGAILKGALQGSAIGSTRNVLLDHLRELPSVWLLGRPDGCWGDVVSSDDVMLGQMAANYAADHGHKYVAVLNPKGGHVLMQRREMSFVQYAERAGLTVASFISYQVEDWKLPLHPVEDVACVRDLLAQLLATEPRPSLVFTPGDSIAGLVYRALAERGMSVGRDLSIISCNNEVPITASLHPSLTTLDVQARVLGEQAVEQLAWRIVHGLTAPAMSIGLEGYWVEGDSVRTLS